MICLKMDDLLVIVGARPQVPLPESRVIRTLYYILAGDSFLYCNPYASHTILCTTVLLIDLLVCGPVSFGRFRPFGGGAALLMCLYSQQHPEGHLTHSRYSVMFAVIVKLQHCEPAYPGSYSGFSNTFQGLWFCMGYFYFLSLSLSLVNLGFV